MLSKCANPGCAAVFRYLHQGKLFLLETRESGTAGKTEYFWLCDSCAPSLTVAVENGQVVTRPLQAPQARVPSHPAQPHRVPPAHAA